MHRRLATLALVALAMLHEALPCAAAVNVERQSQENPMVEISRSTMYGGLLGLAVGGAIALANDGNNDGEILRWSIVAGTFLGLGVGIYFVTHRPQPSAAIELRNGRLVANAPTVSIGADGTVRVPLAAVSF